MSFLTGLVDLGLSAYDAAEPYIDTAVDVAGEGLSAVGEGLSAVGEYIFDGDEGLFSDMLGIFDQGSGGGASADVVGTASNAASDLGSIAPRITTGLPEQMISGVGSAAAQSDGGLLSKFIESPADRAALGTAAKYLLGAQLAKSRQDNRIKEIQEQKKFQGAYYVPANMEPITRRS